MRCEPSIQSLQMFMPNWPHKSGFLFKPQQVPYMIPIGFVVPKMMTLPFVCSVIDPLGSLSDKVSPQFSGIVKKAITFNPSPPIWVPSKSGHFIIEFFWFFFSLPCFPLWWYEWFSLCEKDLPFPQSVSLCTKTTRVGAHCVTLHRCNLNLSHCNYVAQGLCIDCVWLQWLSHLVHGILIP